MKSKIKIKNRLKIAMVAPLWVRVPPKKYGGIELVVSDLTEELIRRGHEVTLFASGDSLTSADELVSIYPRALYDDDVPETDLTYNLMNLAGAFKRADEFDIIHSHIETGLLFAGFTETPMVSTIHLNVQPFFKNDGRILMYEHHKEENFVSISLAQQENSDVALNYVGNAYNGLNPERYEFNPDPEDKFIWISRIDKVKGIIEAIQIAEELDLNLEIAGKIYSEHREFFLTEVKPHLNKKIRYIGEIPEKQKSQFFGSGKALIFPISWDEPFGLVMTEAMACGTPVIAFRRGSVDEVIKNGVSGFAVDTLEEMREAVKNIDTIDRSRCRQWFDENFAVDKMADAYEEIYYETIQDKNTKMRNKGRKILVIQ